MEQISPHGSKDTKISPHLFKPRERSGMRLIKADTYDDLQVAAEPFDVPIRENVFWLATPRNGGVQRRKPGLVEQAAHALQRLALRLDQVEHFLEIAGMPLEWIDYREAARLYHQEQVAYTCGSLLYRLYGGVNALTGLRTTVDVSSIVATVV